VPAPAQPGEYRITVALQYRKVDQFLLNYLFGATNQLTAPVTELTRAETRVVVKAGTSAQAPAPGRNPPAEQLADASATAPSR